MPDHAAAARACACLAQLPPPAPAVPWWWAPLLTAGLTILGAWIAIAFDRRKSMNQELIKKRLELHATYLPLANDIYSYFKCVGGFRKLAPEDVIRRKRELDRFIHIYGALFSSRGFAQAYFKFINQCFSVYQGAGQSAKIRADLKRLKRQFGSEWKPGWDDSFDLINPAKARDVEAAYNQFIAFFAWQVGARQRPWSWIWLRWQSHDKVHATRQSSSPTTAPTTGLADTKHDAVSAAIEAQLREEGLQPDDDAAMGSVFNKTAETLPVFLEGVRQRLEQSTRYRFNPASITMADAAAGTLGTLKQKIIASVTS